MRVLGSIIVGWFAVAIIIVGTPIWLPLFAACVVVERLALGRKS